jgi:hypothetical protein
VIVDEYAVRRIQRTCSKPEIGRAGENLTVAALAREYGISKAAVRGIASRRRLGPAAVAELAEVTRRLEADFEARYRERLVVEQRRQARAAARFARLESARFTEDGFDPRGWFVYLLWTGKDAECPLYVGKTGNMLARPGAHFGREWGAEVGWVTFVRCASERDALAAESVLITRYLPPWNVRGKPVLDLREQDAAQA